MNNAVFGKTMENMRKHRDIKLVTTKKKKEFFNMRTKFSYYIVFHWTFTSNRNKTTEILMNKPVYLGV